MNLCIILMPCLKEKGESPQAMNHMVVPSNTIKMCMIILLVLFSLLTTSWVVKGIKHFPTLVKDPIYDHVLLKSKY